MTEWIGPCPRCGAVGKDVWPHPIGEACPMVEMYAVADERRHQEMHEAQLTLVNAQRLYYERASFQSNDMAGAMQQMGKFFEQQTTEDE